MTLPQKKLSGEPPLVLRLLLNKVFWATGVAAGVTWKTGSIGWAVGAFVVTLFVCQAISEF